MPRRPPNQPPKKPGPKPAIGDKERAEIFACLTVGASLQDAADYIGIDRSTLTKMKARDPEFAQGCMAAIKKGKIHHLNKIGKAPQWQASAFMLERRWYKEFGRKDKVQNEHTGKDGSKLTIEVNYVCKQKRNANDSDPT